MAQITVRISDEAKVLLGELQTLMVEPPSRKLSQGEAIEHLIREEHHAITEEEAHDANG